jgi:predicted ribosome quality control (RQC) complex YloA/Tae2 family protein
MLLTRKGVKGKQSVNFIVSESAEENWKIILQAKRNYYWVHADGRPSAHVIIDTNEPFNEDIKYACNLCAEQTKITNNNDQLYIITQISNIKLGSTPGEVQFRDENKLSYYLRRAREQTK